MTDEQLSEIEQRRQLACAEVIALCNDGQWCMRIPVEKTDSDICIMNALDDVPALVAEVRRLQYEIERFALIDDADTIENLIHRLRRTMSDGELYGVDEQIPQMRYILREAFAPLFAEIIKLRADIERIGRERDQMVAANVELQERLSRLEDDGR